MREGGHTHSVKKQQRKSVWTVCVCMCVFACVFLVSFRVCPSACTSCVSVPHLVVVRSALVAQRVLVGPDGWGCGDVALELGIRGVVDLVVTRKLRVEVGDEGEEMVDGDGRGRYGVGDI